MSKQRNMHGYVLLLTMLIVSLIVSLTTYIAYRTTMFVPYAKIAASQQKARMLAYSGLQLAISQLCAFDPQQENQDVQEKQLKGQAQSTTQLSEKKDGLEKKVRPDTTEIARQLLKNVLPMLNSQQDVPLKKKIDGIDGTIRFAIFCEQGKFDINMLYDFDKHRFVDEKDTPPTQEQKEASIRALFKNIFDAIQKRM